MFSVLRLVFSIQCLVFSVLCFASCEIIVLINSTKSDEFWRVWSILDRLSANLACAVVVRHVCVHYFVDLHDSNT